MLPVLMDCSETFRLKVALTDVELPLSNKELQRIGRVALVGLILLVACGQMPTASPGDTASSVRSTTSSPTPDPNVFQANDCTAAPGIGTTTEKQGDVFGTIVQIPQGWKREAPTASETTMLVLDAPDTYTHQPTRIEILALMGYYPTETPDDVAKQYTDPSLQVVGSMIECSVGSDPAAVLQYVGGTRAGYFVVFLHFRYAYAVRVEGQGGVDTQAVAAAKRLLGSWQWTVTTPPPR